MEIEKIKFILKNNLNLEKINISGDGKHFVIIVVGKIFEKMNKIQRHQSIYKLLFKYILNNTIHAISIHAFSPSEWIYKKNIIRFDKN